MVILHRDNTIYSLPPDKDKKEQLLSGFYNPKFEKILKSNNIPYKVTYYEDYENDLEGDYFVGRFAHAFPDKELHSKCFDKLYNHYGEKMWPNKKAYYYYDDKVRQYELLEKYGIQIPSVTCNDLDELLKTVTIGTVVKSTYGAGGESIFYVWEKEHLDNLESYISDITSKDWIDNNFFPCQVQEFIDIEYETQIFFTNDEVYGFNLIPVEEFNSPLFFPRNRVDGEHWANYVLKAGYDSLSEKEFNLDLIEKLYEIKKELNTPNLKFDIIDNKVSEFSYVYGEMLPGTKSLTYDYYNFDKSIFGERVISINDFTYKQQTSVLKHLGII